VVRPGAGVHACRSGDADCGILGAEG
jgi:hypothetical protein